MLRPALALSLLAGCADAPSETPLDAAPATETPVEAPPPLVYRCESGAEIGVAYPDMESALVTVEGQAHRLVFDETSAEAGAVYADSVWSWLTAGSAGTLRAAGSVEAVERCEQAS